MYGPGRMGYLNRGRGMAPRPGGHASPALVVGVVVGGLFLFLMAGAFDFFPFFFFFWMIPFFLVPALGLYARGVAGLFEARARRSVDDGRREEELLAALARHGELTPARAALGPPRRSRGGPNALRTGTGRARRGARPRGETQVRPLGA